MPARPWPPTSGCRSDSGRCRSTCRSRPTPIGGPVEHQRRRSHPARPAPGPCSSPLTPAPMITTSADSSSWHDALPRGPAGDPAGPGQRHLGHGRRLDGQGDQVFGFEMVDVGFSAGPGQAVTSMVDGPRGSWPPRRQLGRRSRRASSTWSWVVMPTGQRPVWQCAQWPAEVPERGVVGRRHRSCSPAVVGSGSGCSRGRAARRRRWRPRRRPAPTPWRRRPPMRMPPETINCTSPLPCRSRRAPRPPCRTAGSVGIPACSMNTSCVAAVPPCIPSTTTTSAPAATASLTSWSTRVAPIFT